MLCACSLGVPWKSDIPPSLSNIPGRIIPARGSSAYRGSDRGGSRVMLVSPDIRSQNMELRLHEI